MQTFTVGEVAAFLKLLVNNVEELNDIWIVGEVSNYSQSSKGHIYFSLKDAEGQLAVVQFRQHTLWQTSAIRSGMSVLVHGSLDFYTDGGRLQLVADIVQEEGIGRAYLAFEGLKARLEAEGLFSPERKRPLPTRPKVIGIVTSPQAAALQDILNILRRRYPLARVVISPCFVQGEQAPATIVAALERLGQTPDVEVIIVARGGGSAEDLAAFNDERVVRAVFASRVPVVSGVGHETDTTMIDYVADLRAPTPSAAAELVSPDIRDLAERVLMLHTVATEALIGEQLERERLLLRLQQRSKRVSPRSIIGDNIQYNSVLFDRAIEHLETMVNTGRARLTLLQARSKSLNPLAVLERGYAIIHNLKDGEIVTAPDEVAPYTLVEVQFSAGSFTARRVRRNNERRDAGK